MENICKNAMQSVNINDMILLMNHKHFLKIRFNPQNENLVCTIHEINKNNLGDWYDYMTNRIEYMNGILIFCQYGHLHTLFDYVNIDKIIKLTDY